LSRYQCMKFMNLCYSIMAVVCKWTVHRCSWRATSCDIRTRCIWLHWHGLQTSSWTQYVTSIPNSYWVSHLLLSLAGKDFFTFFVSLWYTTAFCIWTAALCLSVNLFLLLFNFQWTAAEKSASVLQLCKLIRHTCTVLLNFFALLL